MGRDGRRLPLDVLLRITWSRVPLVKQVSKWDPRFLGQILWKNSAQCTLIKID